MNKLTQSEESESQGLKKESITISIESLARYTLEQKHPGSRLDFDKQVVIIGGYANFLLLIYSNDNKLIRVYLVSAGRDHIDKTAQPFRPAIMGYFRKYKTDPPENYYIFKIALDEKDQPIDNKLFPVPGDLL